MQMVFTSVAGALGDPESLLSRAITTAMKIGAIPVKALGRGNGIDPEAKLPQLIAGDLEQDEELDCEDQEEAQNRVDPVDGSKHG